MRELNTDRPDKTESPITVDAGHFQVETDIVIMSIDRASEYDATTGETTITKTRSPSYNLMNAKVGVTNWMDFQVVVESYTNTKTTVGNEPSTTQKGFGDTTLRLKMNVLGNDGGPVAIGLMPTIKLPTNTDNRGNKKAELGIMMPVGIELPNDFGMGLMLQYNRNKNELNDSAHNEFVTTMTVGHDIIGSLAGYLEFYSQASDDVGARWTATIDMGLTYGIGEDIQLDAGLNLGVTDPADDYNPFLGLTFRI